MSLVLLIILYMLGNIYTDFRELKTKNKWHMIFLVLGIFSAFILNVDVIKLLGIMTISLGIGLLRENISSIRISAGDTKMITVLTLYYFLFNPHGNILIAAVSIHLSIFIFSLLFTGWISMILLIKSLIQTKGLTGYHSFSFKKMNISFLIDGMKVVKATFCLPASLSILVGPMIYMYLHHI